MELSEIKQKLVDEFPCKDCLVKAMCITRLKTRKYEQYKSEHDESHSLQVASSLIVYMSSMNNCDKLTRHINLLHSSRPDTYKISNFNDLVLEGIKQSYPDFNMKILRHFSEVNNRYYHKYIISF